MPLDVSIEHIITLVPWTRYEDALMARVILIHIYSSKLIFKIELIIMNKVNLLLKKYINYLYLEYTPDYLSLFLLIYFTHIPIEICKYASLTVLRIILTVLVVKKNIDIIVLALLMNIKSLSLSNMVLDYS